jgi:hypothetical protein
MRNRILALLLLLVFGGGLLAGPHPCPAQGTPSDSGKESKPACHGHEAASVQSQGASSSNDDQDDCCVGEQGAGCKHLCHMVALVQVRTAVFAAEPQERLTASTFDRSLPLFAPPIDHIPLA